MKRTKHLATAAVLTLIYGVLVGCAHREPQELIEARQAYEQAQSGPAAEVAQTHLLSAEKALQSAEDAFDSLGDDSEVRDLAYIAWRRAQLAQAQAGIVMAQRAKEDAERQFNVAQARMGQQAREELAQTRQQLLEAERRRAQESAEIARSQGELQTTRQQLEEAQRQREQEMARQQQELESERQARLEAEQRAEQAMRELQDMAQVREEQRGTVITIPGGVLFASAQWALLPSARERLDRVAEVLEGRTNQTILIEGHTDSRGSESYNQDLSVKRANSVRDYLIGRGIDANRVRTLGLGESSPIANNATAEGRAMNRRVEIILERERAALR